MTNSGVAEAVCIGSVAGQVAKMPQAEVEVQEFGFAGDRHAGPHRRQ